MSTLLDRIASDVRGKFLRASDGSKPKDFSTPATLAFDGVTKVIAVLFDENYSGSDQFGNEVQNSGPVAMVDTAEVSNSDGFIPGEVDTDDAPTLTIDGVEYNVTKGARYGDTSILTLSED